MNILFLTNNKDVTLPLYHWLKEVGENIEVVEEKVTANFATLKKSDLIISYNYRHILRRDVIDFVDGRAINLHTSYLPWNRGDNPNVWSFLENTPKGVTIHMIDEGMDTGPILAQKEITFDEGKETLSSSYRFLHEEIQSLFRNHWPQLKTVSRGSGRPQVSGGSVHFIKDFEKIQGLLKPEGWDIKISDIKKKYAQDKHL